MELNASKVAAGPVEEPPWALPTSYHVLFFCLYYTSTVLSIVGNVLVIVVLIVCKRLSLGVRFSLVNLASADLLSAIFYIPWWFTQVVYGYWRYSTALCTISLFADRVTVIVSVLTLSVIGIDRYLAILHPFRFLWLRSDKAVIVQTIALWVIAIVTCSVIFVYPSVTPYAHNGITYDICYNDWPSEKFGQHFYSLADFVYVVFIMTYVVPLTTLTFAYSSIACKLYHHTSPGNADAERDLRQHQNNIKIIKMLVLTVASFILCWTPVQMYTIINFIDPDLTNRLGESTKKLMFLSFHWVSTVNCFLDPTIYCFSRNNFWGDLRYILKNINETFQSESTKIKSRLSGDSLSVRVTHNPVAHNLWRRLFTAFAAIKIFKNQKRTKTRAIL